MRQLLLGYDLDRTDDAQSYLQVCREKDIRFITLPGETFFLQFITNYAHKQIKKDTINVPPPSGRGAINPPPPHS